MYRIITPDGGAVTTDTVTYIKRLGETWRVTDEAHAEGVAVSGQMLPWDKVYVQVIDTGYEIDNIHRNEELNDEICSNQDELLVDQEYRLTMLELGV